LIDLPNAAGLSPFAPLLQDLDNTIVGVDLHPVTGFDHEQRILLQIRHRRCAGDDGAERDLGRHLVENHRARRDAIEARHVKIGGPARRSLGTGKHQDLALEASAAQFVATLDHRAVLFIDTAPAGNRVLGHDRLALGTATYHLAPAQDDFCRHHLEIRGLRPHCSPPLHRPVSAASTQSLTDPNHAETPVIAGR
jgi:hypothetical protein